MALARLNAGIQAAAEHMRLKEVEGSFEWSSTIWEDSRAVLFPIARAAGELLAPGNCRWCGPAFRRHANGFFWIPARTITGVGAT